MVKTFVVFFHTPLSWSPISWLSWLIRVFTGAYYNHVGIVHEVNGQKVITEANEKGVNAMLLSERVRTSPSKLHYISVELKNPDKLMQIWGKGYGEWTLVKYAFAILTKQPMRSKKARTGEVWVCSHVVAWALDMEDWYRVDPKELYNRLNGR